jgi:uncharacterized membrane protein
VSRRFVHRGWLHEHIGVSVTTLWIVFSFVIGLDGEQATAALFGNTVSSISSASATAILSAIAAGMMALTAIVFSLVFVALQMGGTLYSPRIVLVYARTSVLANALGIFIGTFIYALLAIRTIDIVGGPGINGSVVLTAFAWLLASVLAMVLLIPRIRSLSIADVLTMLYRHCTWAARRVHCAGSRERVHLAPATQVVLHEGRVEYLVGLDVARLVRLASEASAVVSIAPAIGDALNDGDRVVTVHGGSRKISERALRSALWLGRNRTVDNDPAFSIRLLVDIAIRALSPAVNDPTTAVSVLDELDGLLRVLARLPLEDRVDCDADGELRLIRAVPSWDDYVTLALTEIAQYGQDSSQVQRRLAALLRDLRSVLPEHRRAAFDRFARFRASASDKQGLGHRLSVS